jgi:uncharacterized membrane protein
METILNYLNDRIGIIPFVIGIVFIAASLIMIVFPPKKINFLYGYRTAASMKNQQVWDFSQNYSAKKMLWCGFVIFSLSFLNLIFDISQEFSLVLGLILLILGCIYMFVSTEKEIKKNFPNQ